MNKIISKLKSTETLTYNVIILKSSGIQNPLFLIGKKKYYYAALKTQIVELSKIVAGNKDFGWLGLRTGVMTITVQKVLGVTYSATIIFDLPDPK